MPYEDLKADFPGCIEKINWFLFGQPVSTGTFPKILQLCSFEYMSKHPEKFSGKQLMKFYHNEADMQYQRPLTTMVRADGGRIGQGSAELDVRIKAHVDKRWKDTMEKEHGFKSYRGLYVEWRREKHAK